MKECLWRHSCRFSPLTCCLLSLLCLWSGEVPRGFLSTLPHGAHQASEAHVLWFLQPTHQSLLHNGYELFITELSISWWGQTDGTTDRWWNNNGRRSFIDDLSEEALPSQSNRPNTTSHTWSDSSTLATVRATCFMVTEGWRKGRGRDIDSLFLGWNNRNTMWRTVCTSQSDGDGVHAGLPFTLIAQTRGSDRRRCEDEETKIKTCGWEWLWLREMNKRWTFRRG